MESYVLFQIIKCIKKCVIKKIHQIYSKIRHVSYQIKFK